MTPRARCARRSACAPDAPVAGVIARLTEQKGHRFLFEALAATPSLADVHLIVVGDGDLRDALVASGGGARPGRARAFSRRAARPRRSAFRDGRVRDAVALGGAAAVAGAGDGRRRPGGEHGGRRHSRGRAGRPDRTPGAAGRRAGAWRRARARCFGDADLRVRIGRCARAAVLPRFGVDGYVSAVTALYDRCSAPRRA